MPGGHRPPHAARTAEVLARTGVVDAAVGGRREHAFDAPDLLRDVEVGAVQLGDRLVGQVLHPVAERLLAGDVAGRLRRRVRPPRRRRVPPGTIFFDTVRISDSRRASSSKPHAYVSSMSIFAPRKNCDASVYLSRPTACFSCARGAISSRRNDAERDRGRSRLVGTLAQVGEQTIGQLRLRGDALDETGVEVVAVRIGPDVALLGDLDHLMT